MGFLILGEGQLPQASQGAFVRAFTQAGGSLCLLDSQLYLNDLDINCQCADLQINSGLLRCVGSNHTGLCRTLRHLSLQQCRPKKGDETDQRREGGLWLPGKVHRAVAAQWLVKPAGDHLAHSACLTLSFSSHRMMEAGRR